MKKFLDTKKGKGRRQIRNESFFDGSFECVVDRCCYRSIGCLLLYKNSK